MYGVEPGNAITDGVGRRGWYIGHFIDDDAFRQTHDVEVIWDVHKKGEVNKGFTADQVARTMSVLIRGRFKLTFRREDETEDIVLKNEGDYVVWLPQVEHTWVAEAEGETVILTVRWPSLPVPQTEKK